MINGAQWEQNCGGTKEGERAKLPGKKTTAATTTKNKREI